MGVKQIVLFAEGLADRLRALRVSAEAAGELCLDRAEHPLRDGIAAGPGERLHVPAHLLVRARQQVQKPLEV